MRFASVTVKRVPAGGATDSCAGCDVQGHTTGALIAFVCVCVYMLIDRS
uniref:Uncharacterized protein n=1 Tax=Anopheles quadriannulatus TaxID=34691 RepID=A0A182XRW5_ANOQN